MLVIPTQEVEAGGSQVQAQPQQQSETLSQKTKNKTEQKNPKNTGLRM
jgi:hypothetical protein